MLEIRSTFDPDFKPVHAARDTVLLLGPQCAAWQISFVVYGIYVGMFIHVSVPTFELSIPASRILIKVSGAGV